MCDDDKTWNELVQEYFPELNDAEAEHVLWSLTAFPFVGVAKIREQLRELADGFKEFNGTLQAYFAKVTRDQEIETARVMRELYERETMARPK
jgi:hypothetical protein